VNPIGILILCAVAEAVVWLWRLRAGVGKSAMQAGLSTVGVCACRVVFLAAGVQASIAGDIWVAGTAYCLAAGVATWVCAAWANTPSPNQPGVSGGGGA
jgi:hypothetical protein